MIAEFTTLVVGGTVVIIVLGGVTAVIRAFFNNRGWDEVNDGDRTWFTKDR